MPRWAVVAVLCCAAFVIWVGTWETPQADCAPIARFKEMQAKWEAERPRPQPRTLGSLEITGGAIVLADPGITRSAVSAGTIAREIPAARGAWQTDVVVLAAPGQDTSFAPLLELRGWLRTAGDPSGMKWEPAGQIEVHGNVAGIFDAPAFLDDSAVPPDFHWDHPPSFPEQKWRSACLELCMGSKDSGILRGAAVASASRGPVKVLLVKDATGVATGVRLILREQPEYYDDFDE